MDDTRETQQNEDRDALSPEEIAFLQNTCKPVGEDGKRMVERMNAGHHAELSEWGFSHLVLPTDIDALDVGCGGGANLARILRLCPNARVTGLDYSEVSVVKSREVNAGSIARGVCDVVLGDVCALPFPDASFDLVTAFETVYFWPDVQAAFCEIVRVLKPGGTFMVCHESDGHDKAGKKWAGLIEGMTVYTDEELRVFLDNAGFASVQSDGVPEKGWLVVIAHKA